MMKNPRNLLIFAVIGGVVGLGLGIAIGRLSVPDRSKLSVSDSRDDMRAVLAAQQKAWNAGDIEGFMQGYVQRDTLRFASGGDITYGWGATLDRYQRRYSDRSKMGTLTFDILSVEQMNAGRGLIFGKWILQREADAPSGLFTLHMVKTKDGWKIVSDHTSSASN
jgi:ketosteroid isomerase-like protein